MLASGLPEHIADDEHLARFLFQSNQFKAAEVKSSAFMPHRQSQETSVFRHGVTPLETLWALAGVAGAQRKVYGAAILTARQVRAVALDLMADDPPARHAAIRGWPSVADPELQKALQLECAKLLAQAAGRPFLK